MLYALCKCRLLSLRKRTRYLSKKVHPDSTLLINWTPFRSPVNVPLNRLRYANICNGIILMNLGLKHNTYICYLFPESKHGFKKSVMGSQVQLIVIAQISWNVKKRVVLFVCNHIFRIGLRKQNPRSFYLWRACTSVHNV
jgi:hypothetical protein